MIPVHIAGVGMTQFGKSSNTLVEIMRAAAVSALAVSKIQDFDAIYIAVMNPEEYTGDANIASHVAEALGFRGIPAVRVETASSAGAAAVHVAYHGVASGYYRHVLVVGGEKMTHLTTSASTRILAEVIDAQERNCGATMPALAAMITARYRKKYRLSESTLAQVLCAVAMKNHANGVHNSYAQIRRGLRKARLLALQLPQRTDYSMREHDQILDAFLKRNPDLAGSTVLKHLANQLTAVKKILQSAEASSHA